MLVKINFSDDDKSVSKSNGGDQLPLTENGKYKDIK